jgi:hypothetical protein
MSNQWSEYTEADVRKQHQLAEAERLIDYAEQEVKHRLLDDPTA